MIFSLQKERFVHKKTMIWQSQIYFQNYLQDIWSIENILHSSVGHAINVCKSQNTMEFCFSCFRPGMEVIS